MTPEPKNRRSVWTVIEEKLGALGIDLDALGVEIGKGKFVCVAPNLGASVREMGEAPRDHVVMVRVDEDTLRKLDAWVETGSVKSRSEAAALFIREGLAIRGDELSELEDALRQVELAKKKLREKAKTVFGAREAKGEEGEA